MNHQAEIIKLALDKMLNKESSFSICSLDRLASTLNVNAELHPDYKQLRALHCVNFCDMSASLKQALPGMIMNCLSGRFDTELMAKALLAVANGEIKNLPNTEDDLPTRSIRLLK